MDPTEDRFQRQARRQSLWREEAGSGNGNGVGMSGGRNDRTGMEPPILFPSQNIDPFASRPHLKRLKHIDTGISPLEPHPGRRLPSIQGESARRLSFAGLGTNGDGWSKPFRSTLEKVEEKASVQESQRPPATPHSADLEDPQEKLGRAAASGRSNDSYLTRLVDLLLRRSPVRRRGHSGIRIASSIATAHVNAFLNLQFQQGLVYISEYEKGKTVPVVFATHFNLWLQRPTQNHVECRHHSIVCQVFKIIWMRYCTTLPFWHFRSLLVAVSH